AEALRLAAALEVRSEHPLGLALVTEADNRNLQYQSASEFEVVAGKGVRGKLDGVPYSVGRPEWILEQGLEFPDSLRDGLAEAEQRGESVIALMDDERAIALFALADRVRSSARAAVNGLKALGIQPVMITGDAEAVARTVAHELGIE